MGNFAGFDDHRDKFGAFHVAVVRCCGITGAAKVKMENIK